MKRNVTELVFILDKSGSMAGLEADTIGGYNTMVMKQQKTEGEAFVTSPMLEKDELKTLFLRYFSYYEDAHFPRWQVPRQEKYIEIHTIEKSIHPYQTVMYSSLLSGHN